jgi:hypothetical protein
MHIVPLILGLVLLYFGLKGVLTQEISVPARYSGMADFSGYFAVVVGVSVLLFSLSLLLWAYFIKINRTNINYPKNDRNKLIQWVVNSPKLQEKIIEATAALGMLVSVIGALYHSISKYYL